MEERVQRLVDFCQGIYRKEKGKDLYQKYLADIECITPQELFLVEYSQLEMGITPREMLTYVDKLINVFHLALENYRWKRPEAGSFLHMMMAENDGLLDRLEEIRHLIKLQSYATMRDELRASIETLLAYNHHLLKLENILFPYMEQKQERYGGLKIMWSLHDLARHQLKEILAHMDNEVWDEKTFNYLLGQLFFAYSGMVQKQSLILFPIATELLTTYEFEVMLEQSFDYAFAYIEPPIRKVTEDKPDDLKALIGQQVIHTSTGSLTFQQVELLISALPVDVTLVDEYDKVAFFSRPKDRIFPRSAAIIGRDVRNCHPPESVHVVEEIVQSFKDGSKHDATFWIQMKGMFIMIQYFALRDALGVYKGTLEVSQEISEIRSLEGEKRLLD